MCFESGWWLWCNVVGKVTHIYPVRCLFLSSAGSFMWTCTLTHTLVPEWQEWTLVWSFAVIAHPPSMSWSRSLKLHVHELNMNWSSWSWSTGLFCYHVIGWLSNYRLDEWAGIHVCLLHQPWPDLSLSSSPSSVLWRSLWWKVFVLFLSPDMRELTDLLHRCETVLPGHLALLRLSARWNRFQTAQCQVWQEPKSHLQVR